MKFYLLKDLIAALKSITREKIMSGVQIPSSLAKLYWFDPQIKKSKV